MGRVLVGIFAVVLSVALIASCQGSDPFGATTREQVRSDAAVAIANIEASAAIEQTAIEAEVAKSTARTWAQTLPIVALIAVGGVLTGMVLYFRWRTHLVRVSLVTSPPLPYCDDQVAALRAYAARTDQVLERHGTTYLLVDRTTGKRVRALPKNTP